MERRKFKRVEINIAVKGKLVDPQKKMDISGDIPLKAKNLSEGGALLEWPRSWNCESCSNCLGWVHNSGCRLKEDGSDGDEFNKDLVPEMHITLKISPSDGMEPMDVLAKVNWVNSSSQQDKDNYNIGVSFIDGQKQEPEIRNRILVAKRQSEND